VTLRDIAYWLFSQTKTTGSFQMAAMLSASLKMPSWTAPSPKKQTATLLSLRCLKAQAAPQAMPMLPPTMPFAPSMPARTSAMCMLPPLPWQ
jgi:hypothetical protein